MVTEYYNYQVLELGVRNHQEQVEYLKKLIEYHKDKARKDAIDEMSKRIIKASIKDGYWNGINRKDLNEIAKEMQE